LGIFLFVLYLMLSWKAKWSTASDKN